MVNIFHHWQAIGTGDRIVQRGDSAQAVALEQGRARQVRAGHPIRSRVMKYSGAVDADRISRPLHYPRKLRRAISLYVDVVSGRILIADGVPSSTAESVLGAVQGRE